VARDARQSKSFFFKKRSKKLLLIWALGALIQHSPGVSAPGFLHVTATATNPLAQTQKSFLLLFSKRSASLLTTEPP
jgi:hypothetical protein